MLVMSQYRQSKEIFRPNVNDPPPVWKCRRRLFCILICIWCVVLVYWSSWKLLNFETLSRGLKSVGNKYFSIDLHNEVHQIWRNYLFLKADFNVLHFFGSTKEHLLNVALERQQRNYSAVWGNFSPAKIIHLSLGKWSILRFWQLV